MFGYESVIGSDIMTEVLTFQQALNKIKVKRLARIYLDTYGPKERTKKKDKKFRKRMKKYIKSLTKMKPKKSDLVAFVSHTMDLDGITPKPVFNIKAIDELARPNYGLEMTPIKECLDIKIVMTWKTRHYLYDLLSEMIYDMTFFGWNQEGLKKEEKKLKKSMKEIKEHPEDLVSWDEFKDEIGVDESEFDHFDHEEYMLMWKVLQYQGKLHDHSVKRETEKVKKALIENGLIDDE